MESRARVDQRLASIAKFSATVLIVVALVGTATVMINKLGKRDNSLDCDDLRCFRDVISQEASTCEEVNVFATTYDPFYKWVGSTSIVSNFLKDEDDKITPVMASLAYQTASLWRVRSNIVNKKDKTTLLFNTPDPHVLGGRISQSNSILRMTINWGISIRECLYKDDKIDELCLWTAPLVLIRSSSSTASQLGTLMVDTPFDRFDPSMSPSDEGYSGSYLTAFASSSLSPPVVHPFQEVQDFWNYTTTFVYEGRSCDRSRSILNVPDLYSYEGSSQFVCGCLENPLNSSGACCFLLLRVQVMDEWSSLLHFNSQACAGGRFWNLGTRRHETSTNSTSIHFMSYEEDWDMHLRIQVNFSSSRSTFSEELVSQGEPYSVAGSCFREWMESQTGKPQLNMSELEKACTSAGVIVSEAEASKNFRAYVIHAGSVERHAQLGIQSNNISCGMKTGQVTLQSHRTCFLPMTNEASAAHVRRLVSSCREMPKVKRCLENHWREHSSRRLGVYVGLMTTVFTLFVSIAGALNNRFRKIEDMLVPVSWQHNGNLVSVMKTCVRAILIVTLIFWNLFNIRTSLMDVRLDPELLYSETVLRQFDRNSTFLLTTNVTMEVTPRWLLFVVMSVTLCIVTVAAIVYIYFVMVHLHSEHLAAQQNDSLSL